MNRDEYIKKLADSCWEVKKKMMVRNSGLLYSFSATQKDIDDFLEELDKTRICPNKEG